MREWNVGTSHVAQLAGSRNAGNKSGGNTGVWGRKECEADWVGIFVDVNQEIVLVYAF